MKNSKEYTKKILNLHQSLKRTHSKVSADPMNVVDSIIYGIISEQLSEKDTEAALKRFSEYFVDLNDLRVSRIEEIAEILGADTPENRQVAVTLTKVLQRIFNENNQINMESILKLGKRQARQKLEKMEELSPYVIDYCMLRSLSSHAIPITQKMVEYLKENDLVDKDANAQEVEGFLTKQISAKNGYEFYSLLRNESETESSTPKKVKKTATRTKTTKEKTSTTSKKSKKKVLKK